MHRYRVVVPRPAIKIASRQLFVHAFHRITVGPPVAPLLEVEGHTRVHALIAERASPGQLHRSGFAAALTAGDDPVNARKPWREVHIPQEWLARKKPYRGRNLGEVRDPNVSPFLILCGSTEPDVL